MSQHVAGKWPPGHTGLQTYHQWDPGNGAGCGSVARLLEITLVIRRGRGHKPAPVSCWGWEYILSNMLTTLSTLSPSQGKEINPNQWLLFHILHYSLTKSRHIITIWCLRKTVLVWHWLNLLGGWRPDLWTVLQVASCCSYNFNQLDTCHLTRSRVCRPQITNFLPCRYPHLHVTYLLQISSLHMTVVGHVVLCCDGHALQILHIDKLYTIFCMLTFWCRENAFKSFYLQSNS